MFGKNVEPWHKFFDINVQKRTIKSS